MKFVQDRPYTKPDAAVRRLLEIANGTDSDRGEVDVGQVNIVFLRESESPDECRTSIERLKPDGLIEIHASGTYFTFTDKRAQRFA